MIQFDEHIFQMGWLNHQLEPDIVSFSSSIYHGTTHISVKNFPETHFIFGSTANTGFQWQIKVLVGIPETKNVSCHPGGDEPASWVGGVDPYSANG